MSDTVSISLIIGVVVLVCLFALRNTLKQFGLKINGLSANVKTHERPGVNITGNKQSGKNHLIKTERNDINISDNFQVGEQNVIVAEVDAGPKSSN